MTKDEIEKLADKWYNENGKISPSVIEKTAFIVGYKVAYQETERLRAELEYQKKKVETLQSCMLDTSRRLNTELTELKERHKRYAIDFANFIALKGYTLIQKNISENGATFFIDKKSIGVNSIELYEQYYKQKFESND